MSFDFTHRDAANDAIDRSRRNGSALAEVQRKWDAGTPKIAGAAIVSPAQAVVLRRLDRTVPKPTKRVRDQRPMPTKDDARKAWEAAGGTPEAFEQWWRSE